MLGNELTGKLQRIK